MQDAGAYSLTNAARLTQTSPSTARSWFKGRSDGQGRGPVLKTELGGEGRQFAVSFLDLIDLLVAGRLREKGVKLPVIRRAYNAIGEVLDTAHPFSHDAIHTDGRRIFLEVAEQLNSRSFHDAIDGQLLLPCVHDMLEHVDYATSNRMAERWRIAEGIVIDPAVMWGEPIIGGTRLPAAMLAQQYRANDNDAGIVADLYDVDEQDVHDAVHFAERYGYRLAA